MCNSSLKCYGEPPPHYDVCVFEPGETIADPSVNSINRQHTHNTKKNRLFCFHVCKIGTLYMNI